MINNTMQHLQNDLTDDPLIPQDLLHIGNALAAARKKDDLIDVLLERLSVLIPFDAILITIYNKEDDCHHLWVHSSDIDRQPRPEFVEHSGSVFPAGGDVFNLIGVKHFPTVFDIDVLTERGALPDYFNYYRENGMVEFAGAMMRNPVSVVGGFFLISRQKGNFTKEHLSIINIISGQLGIASFNVLANEAIIKHEVEKSILLKLSNTLASVKTKHDLLGIVRKNIEKIPRAAHVVLSYYDAKKSFHYIFNTDGDPLLAPEEWIEDKVEANKIFGKEVNDQIIHAKKPVNFEISDLMAQGKDTDYIRHFLDKGIRGFTGIAMRSEDNLLGCLYMGIKGDFRFKNGELEFIQGIADQLTVALINIETSNEILEREKEKSILLTISNDMAAIRNKTDLLHMVQKRLKSLIHFSHAVTAVANLETRTYTGLVVDPQSKSRGYSGFERIVYANYTLDHPIIKTVLSAKEPTVFDLDELIQIQDLPEWISMNYKSGVKEMVVTPLYDGHVLIGLFVLFSDQKKLLQEKEIRLIQGISWQFSVAVANILANEHVVERNNEKSALLDLSKHFAVIRNKADLHHIINMKLKKLLSISHVITFTISEDGKWYSAYSLDPHSIATGHKDYTRITGSRYPVHDGMLEVVLASETPLVYDLEEVVKWTSVPQYLQMNYDVGIKEAILAPLKDGDKKTGILIILMNKKSTLNQNYIELIQGVSDQLSIAVANIKANEKIELQLEEIKQYKKRLEEENLYLQEEIQITHNYSELIGNSPVMEKTFHLVSKVAESESTVLILGETGTGKELVARAIHSTSRRRDKVMIKVNCATLPANLIESELFGHERGSFTGATEKRIGKFELANNSTLFLDEVGELPLDLQVKLLRVLQEREIERVGGRSTIKTNVRIIAATNRDLQKEVQMGSFRSDLFFRLNVFPINIPSLRERKEDIPLLATHFLAKHATKSMKGNMSFSGKAIRALVGYDWPGNVRELEHLIERSILLSNGKVIDQVYLPSSDAVDESLLPDGRVKTIDEVEREHIISVLKRVNGKVSGIGGAAELLKIPATTLSSKILRLKIGKGLMSKKNR